MALSKTRPGARQETARGRAGRVPDETNLLAVTLWDLRANLEAQLRAMTAMQRCVDTFREAADRKALTETARHLEAVTEGHRAGGDCIEQAQETLAVLMRATSTL